MQWCTTSDGSVLLLVRSPHPDVPVGALSFLSQVPSRLLPQPSDAPHCRPACLCSLALSSGMGNKIFFVHEPMLKMMSTPVAIILMNMTTIAEVSSLFADVDSGHSNLVIMHCTHCTLAFLSPKDEDEDKDQKLCSTDHFNCGQCPISEFANLGAWHSILSWSRIFPSLSHFHP